jgi:copper chaperone CopZ
MKTIVYAIAGIAALGIMIALIASPSNTPAPASATPAATVSATPEVLNEAGTLTLEVPSMHCQFACYPHVKETLEKTAGVSEVALAEQPDPNALTVKKVIVTYDAGFDLSAALSSLKQEGFDDATRVQ